MSGAGQREEPELEKGQKKESKKVKGKLRKSWTAYRKNDETKADKDLVITNLTPGQMSVIRRK